MGSSNLTRDTHGEAKPLGEISGDILYAIQSYTGWRPRAERGEGRRLQRKYDSVCTV